MPHLNILEEIPCSERKKEEDKYGFVSALQSPKADIRSEVQLLLPGSLLPVKGRRICFYHVPSLPFSVNEQNLSPPAFHLSLCPTLTGHLFLFPPPFISPSLSLICKQQDMWEWCSSSAKVIRWGHLV